MSIYHLHIPRTSGIYVKQNILPHLITNKIKHFVSNRTFIDIKKIETSEFVGGHFGLMPLDYMNKPTVFSIIRHPLDRFISYFKYTTGLIRSKKEIEEKIESWLHGEQAEIQSNSQAKFLTGKMNIDKFNKNINFFQSSVNNNWFIENYSLDLNDIIDNINNFYCYSMDNHNLFLEDLNKALKKEFNFTTFYHKDKANRSPEIEFSLNKKQVDRVLELNQIDMEIYEYVQKSKKRF